MPAGSEGIRITFRDLNRYGQKKTCFWLDDVFLMRLPDLELGGVVFEDTNRNGLRDAGERGVSNVAVSNDRKIVFTNKDGEYSLQSAWIGKYVFITVPRTHESTTNFYKLLPIDATKALTADFGLAPYSNAAKDDVAFVLITDAHIGRPTVPQDGVLEDMKELNALGMDFIVASSAITPSFIS